MLKSSIFRFTFLFVVLFFLYLRFDCSLLRCKYKHFIRNTNILSEKNSKNKQKIQNIIEMIELQDFSKLLDDLKNGGFIYNDADFCRKTGIHRSTVSEMRTGKKEFNEQYLRKIKQTFPDFFGEKSAESSPYERTDVDRFLSIIEADHQLIREMVAKKDEEIDRLLAIMEADRGISYKKANVG